MSLFKWQEGNVFFFRGGTLTNVTGTYMDSVASPSISTTVVTTRVLSNGTYDVDNGVTNTEVIITIYLVITTSFCYIPNRSYADICRYKQSNQTLCADRNRHNHAFEFRGN
jgi:hypothetical protein